MISASVVQHPDALGRQWQHDFLKQSPQGEFTLREVKSMTIGVFSTAKMAAELRSIVADDAVLARQDFQSVRSRLPLTETVVGIVVEQQTLSLQTCDVRKQRWW